MIIRKISIGPDYKNAMFFQVGQEFRGMSVYSIELSDDSYDIYIERDGEIILWKKVIDMPVILEYDIEGF